jgi:NAD(P)-dependent dehydrogenase (short-subunit alcohol dehydrogenase family)
MNRFAGKVALVTGAGSGIGAACVDLFTAEGALVVGVDINDTNEAVLYGDVTDPASVDAFVAETVARHGAIDIVANVAGMVRFSHVEATTLEDWDQHLAVNLTGPFLVSQAALPHLFASRGTIINVASIAGVKGQAYTAPYSAAKGGLVMLTKSMALEIASRHVRVNCVCPSGVDTPLIGAVAATIPADVEPRLFERLSSVLDGMVDPADIAEAVAYLASDAARMITGTAMLIDGGTQS